VVLTRQGRGDRVALLTVPLGLALLASCLHRYPYGGVRVIVFAAPAVLLLIAAGTPAAYAWLRARARWGAVVLTGLLLFPLAVSLYRVAVPWERPDTASAAAYVEAHRRPDDPVVGNDGTHLYYFRRLGPAFHWPWEDPHPPAGDRLWVVWTDLQPHAIRVQGARGLAPGDWRLVEEHEFYFTTVVLLARNRPAK
jgi:hypothetical protein